MQANSPPSAGYLLFVLFSGHIFLQLPKRSFAKHIEKKIDTATRSTSPNKNACAPPSRDYSECAAW